MKCPKCQADMVEIREEDVYIDICKECRGVFLDAGELHALLHERPHHDNTKDKVFRAQPHHGEYQHHHEHSPHKHNHQHNHHYYNEKHAGHMPHKHHKKKKKKMHHVLGDLFDF